MTIKKNLLLITLSFPYDIGAEDTFLKNEVKLYPGNFVKVNILPCLKSQGRAMIDPSIYVDNCLSEYNNKGNILLSVYIKTIVSATFFFEEFVNRYKKVLTFDGFKKLVSNYFLVCKFIRFFELYFRNLEKEEWIIYTYWFTPVTTAAVLFAAKRKNVKVVTRSHGIDLYEYRNSDYIPFRERSIELLDRYFFVSDFGKKYTQILYPQFINKLEVFPLAVQDTMVITKPSDKGCLNIVSCSTVDNNKRVSYILEAILELTNENNSLKVKWDHFGAGPLLDETKDLAGSRLKVNFEFKFHGSIDNSSIIKFYNENNIDVFITTTSSEGGRPVSIMEAFSCHIPVIATKVGGIPELVNWSNGYLLEEKLTIHDVSTALKWFAENKNGAIEKGRAARNTWEQKCNPEVNFSNFVKQLSTI